MQRIYFDNAATTLPYSDVIDEMASLSKTVYGNPSSLHSEGSSARKIQNNARQIIASCLGCSEGEICFTSGGSEANNQAILGTLKMLAGTGKNHIITTCIEHPSVLKTLENNNINATLVKVSREGIVSPADIEKAVTPKTALVSVMTANNEIGTIQPVLEIAEVCKAKGVLFHTDGVSAVGKIPVDVKKSGVDMLSLSSHKFHGPKGIGVLFVKERIKLPPIISGGNQEKGRRASTENFISAYGMALALKKSVENIKENNQKTEKLRNILIEGISGIKGVHINGDNNRLSNIVSVCFEGIDGEALAHQLDLKGIAASTGSACHSGTLKPSYVLLALGLDENLALGSLRLSLCEYNTPAEADYAVETIKEIVEKLRSIR